MSKIIISRTSQRSNFMRGYDIYIDNERIDAINNGKKKIIEVSQGNHEIYMKIDWCKSKKLNVNLTKGQELNLKCGSKITGIKQVFVLLYIFSPLKYLYLDYLSEGEVVFNDNNIKTWNEVKSMGMRNFILKYGIMKWGVPTGILYFVITLLFSFNIGSIRSFILSTVINLLIFILLGGSLFGFLMWGILEKENT